MRRATGITVALITFWALSGMVIMAADVPKAPVLKSAEAEYRLGPEDVIDVFVWKEPDLTTTVTIRPDGRISLPLTDQLDAAGKTAAQLQQEIAEKLKQFISNPVVNVIVRQVNSLKISVLGEVKKPDIYRIKNRVTVLDAIAMAGGFTEFAKPSKVVILRNTPQGQQRYQINIKQAVSDSAGAPIYLQPMDTVYVE
jgi:polysaccharide biosynthesis/export protein